ncbi:hypothetical protein PG988_013586 [Apiospora saccharicola]
MARKATKKIRKPQIRVTWDFSKDVVPLLAWLDYCIQHGVDFNSTVVDHLQAYANKDVQLTQVDGKLRTLWGNWGHIEKFDDFKYQQGSSVLGLTPIEHEAVEKFRKGLPPPPARPDAMYQLEGITSGLPTRSQTLSEQRQASDDSSLSGLSSISDPDERSDAAARITRPGFSEQFARSKVSSTLLRIAPGQPVAKSIASRETQTTPIRHGVTDGVTNTALEKDFIVGEHMIKQMRSEVVTLAGRLHEARQERDELLHCTRAAEGAADKTGMLVSLQHENIVLRKQLLAFQEGRENAALCRTGNLGPSVHEIGAELSVVESSIADACASLHWDGWLLDRPKGAQPGMADRMISQWAHTLSGSPFGSFMASCGDASGVSMVDALRALVAVALWALVWQQPLEEIVNADSPILDYYKKQLLARDGPVALHQIELLAYKSLTSQSHFDVYLVDGRSRTLSEYICHVLDPLFRRDPKPQAIGGSEATVMSTDEKPPGLLEDAVQRALRLAAKLYLTDRWCLWQFARPGCRLDAQTMKVAAQAAVHSSTEEPVVKLCVFPALYMSKTPKDPHAYERVGGAGSRGPEDLRDCKLVAKGLVLV